MMTSIDGRIDCAMTARLQGTDDYYRVLDELNFDVAISGKATAALEMASPGKFEPKNPDERAEEGFSRKTDATRFDAVVDSKGELLWDQWDADANRPLIVIASRRASKEYLAYLDSRDVSWIVVGDDRVNLVDAVKTLADRFGAKRIGVVGGPTINTSFLEAGLIDEVVLLIGPGIDGRAEMPSVFEGRVESEPLPLKLLDAKTFESGAVLIRYSISRDGANV